MTHMFSDLPHPLLAPVIDLCRRAGEATLLFWRSGVEVTAKPGDLLVRAPTHCRS